MLRACGAQLGGELILTRGATWPFSKNVTWLTWGAKWPFRCLDDKKVMIMMQSNTVPLVGDNSCSLCGPKPSAATSTSYTSSPSSSDWYIVRAQCNWMRFALSGFVNLRCKDIHVPLTGSIINRRFLFIPLSLTEEEVFEWKNKYVDSEFRLHFTSA